MYLVQASQFVPSMFIEQEPQTPGFRDLVEDAKHLGGGQLAVERLLVAHRKVVVAV